MSKKESNTGLAVADELLRVPEGYGLAQGDAGGTELLGEFVRPPRAKMVQKTADDELLKDFKPGDLILVPQKVLVASRNGSFLFTPVFFFPEWCKVTPLKLKGAEPMIVERSTDPKSSLAIKSRNEATRREPHPNYPGDRDYDYTYVENLNFISVLHDGPMAGMPFVLAFSKAEWKVGSSFASLIKMRNAKIFACVFEGRISDTPRKNAKGEWFGVDVVNPTSGSPWVESERYTLLEALHNDLKAKHAEGLIQVDYDDPDGGEKVSNSPDTEY